MEKSLEEPTFPSVEFRILGPFGAYADGAPLSIGGGKQRALLCVLLLHAGESVSADQLIEALWGDDPPASALNSVHVYVSQLRKALGDERLLTRAHGYALELGPDELDASRFERLLAQGRDSLAAEQPREAVATLSEALATWRGHALADFAYEEFAREETARLEALRLDATEERIEAELVLGRASAVVAELETLVRARPLRERLRGQLMVALYRCGRQAEALEIYRDGRRLLAEELGLDPGPELQKLERSILTQDPGLAAAPIPPAHVVGSRRGPSAVVVAGVALLLAAIAFAVALARPDEVGLASVAPNSVGVIDPESDQIVAQISVGNTPTRLAVGAGSVWAINADDRTVSQIDAGSLRLLRTVSVGPTPTDIVVGAGALWVGGDLPVGVTRLDGRSGVVTDRLKFAARSSGDLFTTPGVRLAIGFGSVWAAASIAPPRDFLARIDPKTVRPTATIRPADVGPLTAGPDAVWMVQYGTLTRVDPIRGTVARRTSLAIKFHGELVADEDYVWGIDEFEDTVWQIDARSQQPLRSIQVGKRPSGLAIGFGSVWVSSQDGTVTRIDRVSHKVVKTIRVGGTLNGIAVGEGAVWVAVG